MKPIKIEADIALGPPVLCPVCTERLARWAVRGSGPLCSLCFLYQSEEGCKKTAALSSYLDRVETERGAPYERDEDGRLVNVSDGDAILGVLVMTKKLWTHEDMMLRLRGERG